VLFKMLVLLISCINELCIASESYCIGIEKMFKKKGLVLYFNNNEIICIEKTCR
jgi:hypothetical protein